MTRKKKSPTASLVRSSAAEYLTFVAASGGGGVEAIYADENVWLSQKMMAQLNDVEVPTINYHLKKVFSDSELEEEAVIRNFRITASDGKSYETNHYNLSAIIAVSYKVNSERAVQFRKWATRVVEEFTIKGFAMDDERLKCGGSVLSDRYFEEQLQRVREIRHGPAHLDRRAPRQDPEVRRGRGQELPDRARARAALPAGERLPRCGRGHGTPQDPHDHAGLGDAAESLPRRDRPRGALGRWQGDGGNRQGARRERVRRNARTPPI
jgi:hypothetical protein